MRRPIIYGSKAKWQWRFSACGSWRNITTECSQPVSFETKVYDHSKNGGEPIRLIYESSVGCRRLQEGFIRYIPFFKPFYTFYELYRECSKMVLHYGDYCVVLSSKIHCVHMIMSLRSLEFKWTRKRFRACRVWIRLLFTLGNF